MVTFSVKPHSIDGGVQVVELHYDNRLLAVIYPGSGPDDREAHAIRIESRYLVDSPGIKSHIVRFV